MLQFEDFKSRALANTGNKPGLIGLQDRTVFFNAFILTVVELIPALNLFVIIIECNGIAHYFNPYFAVLRHNIFFLFRIEECIEI